LRNILLPDASSANNHVDSFDSKESKIYETRVSPLRCESRAGCWAVNSTGSKLQ
jgi:hypothetical protein